MSFLDALIYGYRTVYAAGVAVTRRSDLNFVSGATVADNPATGRTDVTISGGATVAVPMRTSAVPTTLVTGTDFHLTMTVAGAVTLPTAPAAGTSFEVKDVPGGSTLTAGGADTIDGAATYVMVANECQTLRYNATATRWELC